MKAKSLSVFHTRLRRDDPGRVLVNIDQIIESDEEHLRALERNGLVEIIEDDAEAEQHGQTAEGIPHAEPDRAATEQHGQTAEGIPQAESAEEAGNDAQPETETRQTPASGKRGK